MTPQQARAIYSLTATPEWQKLNEHWQAEINDLNAELNNKMKDALEPYGILTQDDFALMKGIYGRLIQLEYDIKLREMAEAVLESNNK